MLRSGVSFPVLMKLLGHVDPGMTMRYVDVALTDLEREFQLARSKPRHLAPQPKTSTAPVRTGIDGLIDSLVAAQHVMEMFRRSLPNGQCSQSSPQALHPPHQDPRRDKKTPDQLNENGKRLAAYGDLALNEIPGANHSSLPGKPAFGRFIDEWKGSFYLEFLIWISARSEIRR